MKSIWKLQNWKLTCRWHEAKYFSGGYMQCTLPSMTIQTRRQLLSWNKNWLKYLTLSKEMGIISTEFNLIWNPWLCNAWCDSRSRCKTLVLNRTTNALRIFVSTVQVCSRIKTKIRTQLHKEQKFILGCISLLFDKQRVLPQYKSLWQLISRWILSVLLKSRPGFFPHFCFKYYQNYPSYTFLIFKKAPDYFFPSSLSLVTLVWMEDKQRWLHHDKSLMQFLSKSCSSTLGRKRHKSTMTIVMGIGQHTCRTVILSLFVKLICVKKLVTSHLQHYCGFARCFRWTRISCWEVYKLGLASLSSSCGLSS